MLPCRIQGRTALLFGEIRWLPNPNRRTPNAIGLANSDILLTDPDGGLANAHIRFPYPNSRLPNAVALADPHVPLTNSNGALSNAVWLADSDSRCADSSLRFASQTR